YSISGGILEAIKNWFQKFRPTPNTETQKTAATKKISETISAGDGKNPVHVEISADIPAGTTVQFTLRIVNAKGKITTQQGSLSHEAGTKPKSTKSSPTPARRAAA